MNYLAHALISDLKTEYMNDPTSQPTAFWKFEEWASHQDMSVYETNGTYSFVLGNALLYRYPLDSGYFDEIDSILSTLVFAKNQRLDFPWVETKFFKLYHDHSNVDLVNLPDAFEFREVEQNEFVEVCKIINESYENIKVNEEQVWSWTTKNVYNPKLWIWIINKETEKKVALGIADMDCDIGEGALEWIQVDSNYRGYGLGKALVNELLRRIALIGNFTSVSGELDNQTQPERLYRSCGFKGDRIWHIYRRK